LPIADTIKMPFDVISHTCSVTLGKASVTLRKASVTMHKASMTLRKASVCVAWLHASEPRLFLFNVYNANDSLAKIRQPLAKSLGQWVVAAHCPL